MKEHKKGLTRAEMDKDNRVQRVVANFKVDKVDKE